PDGDEDPDLDSLATLREFQVGTNPLVADSDGDGWNDESEVTTGSLPLDGRSVPFRWVGTVPPLQVTAGAFGGGTGFAVGLVSARPPTAVTLPSCAGAPYADQAITVAAPPLSVTVGHLDGALPPGGLAVALPPVSVLASDGVVNPANGHRYYLLPYGTWGEAEATAAGLGGHLVTLDDQAEQDWVVATFATDGAYERDLWCGLYDPDPLNNSTDVETRKAEFQWTSGEPVTYLDWLPGQPDNYQGIEFFTYLVSAQNNPWATTPNWGWNDASSEARAY
ncbi:MAG: hypothetical protein KDM81_21865, partial [Verrucomicrobiae bacterium]|nr:hypothetical protein [Verrucomicrobiae bacterium]